jgi:hypothetical protein
MESRHSGTDLASASISSDEWGRLGESLFQHNDRQFSRAGRVVGNPELIRKRTDAAVVRVINTRMH